MKLKKLPLDILEAQLEAMQTPLIKLRIWTTQNIGLKLSQWYLTTQENMTAPGIVEIYATI